MLSSLTALPHHQIGHNCSSGYCFGGTIPIASSCVQATDCNCSDAGGTWTAANPCALPITSSSCTCANVVTSGFPVSDWNITWERYGPNTPLNCYLNAGRCMYMPTSAFAASTCTTGGASAPCYLQYGLACSDVSEVDQAGCVSHGGDWGYRWAITTMDGFPFSPSDPNGVYYVAAIGTETCPGDAIWPEGSVTNQSCASVGMGAGAGVFPPCPPPVTSDTALLIRSDANSGQVFNDLSTYQHNIIPHAAARHTTADALISGGTAMYLGGANTNGDYLTVGHRNSTAWDWGTNEWTIELSFKATGVGPRGGGTLLSKYDCWVHHHNNNPGNEWFLAYTANQVYFSFENQTCTQCANYSLPNGACRAVRVWGNILNKWHHVVIQRVNTGGSSGTSRIEIYLDGCLGESIDIPTSWSICDTANTDVIVGQFFNGGGMSPRGMLGYMDNIRITKNKALYSQPFCPPCHSAYSSPCKCSSSVSSVSAIGLPPLPLGGSSIGACCVGDNCFPTEGAAMCASLGGAYQGHGTLCTPNLCASFNPAPPCLSSIDANTVLLVRSDGNPGTATFKDLSPWNHTISKGGNTTVTHETANTLISGGTAIDMNPTGMCTMGGHLKVGAYNSPAFDFGTGEWTIETSFKQAPGAAFATLMAKWLSQGIIKSNEWILETGWVGGTGWVFMGLTGPDAVACPGAGAAYDGTPPCLGLWGHCLNYDRWNHVAIQRVNTTTSGSAGAKIQMFVNGNLQDEISLSPSWHFADSTGNPPLLATNACTPWLPGEQQIIIGQFWCGQGITPCGFQGQIDNARITKGKAMYNGSFCPPCHGVSSPSCGLCLSPSSSLSRPLIPGPVGGNPSMGACCVGDVCYITPSMTCAAVGGTYLGHGTSCTPNPCSSSGGGGGGGKCSSCSSSSSSTSSGGGGGGGGGGKCSSCSSSSSSTSSGGGGGGGGGGGKCSSCSSSSSSDSPNPQLPPVTPPTIGCTLYVINNDKCPSATATLDFSGLQTTYQDCCGCAEATSLTKHDYCSSICISFPSNNPSPKASILLKPGKYCFWQEFEVVAVCPPGYYYLSSSSSVSQVSQTPSSITIPSMSSSSTSISIDPSLNPSLWPPSFYPPPFTQDSSSSPSPRPSNAAVDYAHFRCRECGTGRIVNVHGYGHQGRHAFVRNIYLGLGPNYQFNTCDPTSYGTHLQWGTPTEWCYTPCNPAGPNNYPVCVHHTAMIAVTFHPNHKIWKYGSYNASGALANPPYPGRASYTHCLVDCEALGHIQYANHPTGRPINQGLGPITNTFFVAHVNAQQCCAWDKKLVGASYAPATDTYKTGGVPFHIPHTPYSPCCGASSASPSHDTCYDAVGACVWEQGANGVPAGAWGCRQTTLRECLRYPINPGVYQAYFQGEGTTCGNTGRAIHTFPAACYIYANFTLKACGQGQPTYITTGGSANAQAMFGAGQQWNPTNAAGPIIRQGASNYCYEVVNIALGGNPFPSVRANILGTPTASCTTCLGNYGI